MAECLVELADSVVDIKKELEILSRRIGQ